MPPAIAIHGGAWNIPDRLVEPSRAGLARILAEAWSELKAGLPAVDAVERAVRGLEDDPTFNAGRGAHLNQAGKVELDASIMDGRTLEAGGVGAVTCLRHPVSLARRVMERSRHVLLVAEGARRFAAAEGIPRCRTRDLLVGRELERWERIRRGERGLVRYEFRGRHRPPGPWGTVGAVAIDVDGHVAAATSTGGTQDKAPGRVGDSAVIGAGTYADDRAGAVSCTGWGESILRVAMARTAVSALPGRSPGRAARMALAALARVDGVGGLIVVDRAGRTAAIFNTPRMARGLVSDRAGLRVAVERTTRR